MVFGLAVVLRAVFGLAAEVLRLVVFAFAPDLPFADFAAPRVVLREVARRVVLLLRCVFAIGLITPSVAARGRNDDLDAPG